MKKEACLAEKQPSNLSKIVQMNGTISPLPSCHKSTEDKGQTRRLSVHQAWFSPHSHQQCIRFHPDTQQHVSGIHQHRYWNTKHINISQQNNSHLILHPKSTHGSQLKGQRPSWQKLSSSSLNGQHAIPSMGYLIHTFFKLLKDFALGLSEQ